jgi:hypothetical protein
MAGTKPGHDGKRIIFKLLYKTSRHDPAAAASRRFVRGTGCFCEANGGLG